MLFDMLAAVTSVFDAFGKREGTARLCLSQGKDIRNLKAGDRVTVGADEWTVADREMYKVYGNARFTGSCDDGISNEIVRAVGNIRRYAVIRIQDGKIYLLQSCCWNNVRDSDGAIICEDEFETPLEDDAVRYRGRLYPYKKTDHLRFSRERLCFSHRCGDERRFVFMEKHLNGQVREERKAFFVQELYSQ